MKQERARYILVSNDGKGQLLYELSDAEIMMMVNGTLQLSESQLGDGTWALISMSGSMEQIDHIMNEFIKK